MAARWELPPAIPCIENEPMRRELRWRAKKADGASCAAVGAHLVIETMEPNPDVGFYPALKSPCPKNDGVFLDEPRRARLKGPRAASVRATPPN